MTKPGQLINKIVIIGGGAAGMMAAVKAAENGNEVILLEKNEKLGKKIYITGKGRCNCTNSSPIDEYPQFYISNPRFTYSAFNAFTNDDLITFLKKYGTECKIERGNRVFPVSDHASDVTRAFEKALKELSVKVRLHTEVSKIIIENDDFKIADSEIDDSNVKNIKSKIKGVKLKNGEIIECSRVIVATGGVSYPTTGSTGDGYRFASETGHRVTALRPALVRIVLREKDIKELEGLSLKNVELNLKLGKRKYVERGELLFTDDGISGPLVLTASSYMGKYLEKDGMINGYIDFKPALSHEQLEKRMIREFEERKNQDIKNVMSSFLPSSMILVFLKRIDLDSATKIHDLSKNNREKIINQLKAFEINVIGTGSFKEAIVTQGGINVKDINPSTMESKIVSGLFFAGEVIDVDGVTGGFNLQFAFSSGYLSGMNV